MSEKAKPWSLDDFDSLRAYNVAFCREELIPLINNPECRRVILRAPVKSGKREFAEYLALRDRSSSDECRENIFISAWHRAADESQRNELREHNLKVFSVNNKKNKDDCIRFITERITLGKSLLIHLDECDHGSGSKQLLSSVWRLIRTNPLCTTILYSATPEEAMLSKDFINDHDIDPSDEKYSEMLDDFESTAEVVEYKPPETFCGPSRFLQENLVINAHPFFERNNETGEYHLSEQARKIITDHKEAMANTPRRNIIMLRLSYSSDKAKGQSKHDTKAIYQFAQTIFPELSGYSIIFDKSNGFDISQEDLENITGTIEAIQWSSKAYWKKFGPPCIMIYDQTCSRSTELACHDRIFATHDFRNTITYSVLSQAQERPNHYTTKYGRFQPIRIYGHLPTFELSAKQITYADYMNRPYKMKQISTTPPLFQVVEIKTNTVLEEYVTERDADHKMMDLGCFGMIPKLSARIAGSVKKKAILLSEFIACDSTTFDSVARPRIISRLGGDSNETQVNTPFIPDSLKRVDIESGKIKGNLRGYKILDYGLDVEQSKWGFLTSGDVNPLKKPLRMSICYQGETLGVGFRIQTGTGPVSSLSSSNSIFESIIVPNKKEKVVGIKQKPVATNVESNAVLEVKKLRPTSKLECFRRDTVLWHFKPKDNIGQYAKWIVSEKRLHRCSETGEIISGAQSFETINSWTQQNLSDLGKKTINNNCYTNVKYKSNNDLWVLCDDMTRDAVITY